MFWHVVCFLVIHSLNHRIKLLEVFLKRKVFFAASQKLVRSMVFNPIFAQYQTNFFYLPGSKSGKNKLFKKFKNGRVFIYF